jgi:SAM-dependent methyltransferase
MKRGQRVLDLGAHLNETLLDAAELLFPGQLLGTCEDLTRGFELERLATGLELLNVTYRRTQPDALPFPARDFDGVLALQAPENPDLLQAQLDEIQRVLRPGGWVALQTRLPEETLEEILADTGLKLQAVLAEHEGWIRVRAVRVED